MPRTLRVVDGGKRHPLNMRTTKETRDRLEAAAVASGRSLVQEVEARLERSFQTEQALGSPEMARIAFNMAASFAVATQGADWTSDPIAYGRGVGAVVATLLRNFPEGEGKSLAISGTVSSVLTQLAQAQEEEK